MKRVIYLDTYPGMQYSSAFQPTLYQNILTAGYNVLIMGFYLPTLQSTTGTCLNIGPCDAALVYMPISSKPANLTILLSVGGSTFIPNASNFSSATDIGKNVGIFAATNYYDGFDFDIENIGSAFGYYPWNAFVVPWLVELTNSARASFMQNSNGKIPIITHAPVAPYFSTSNVPTGIPNYADFNRLIGDNVSWYNVQFYNQDTNGNNGICTANGNTVPCCYTTAIGLSTNSSDNCASSWVPGSSVSEIASTGVLKSKIIIGKPLLPSSANSGQIQGGIKNLMGTAKYGGIMGWEYDGTAATDCSVLYGYPCV